MNVFVTGAAGFVGSNLVSRLIREGHNVVGFDNLSAGSLSFLNEFTNDEKFKFIRGDLLDLPKLVSSMAGASTVFHLAANSDITQSRLQTDLDLRQGTIATFNVLEAMRQNTVGQIVFSSSSVVYGEASIIPTPEDYGPLLPISLYGASKLASEGLISSFCHNFGFQAWIFRFANICGLHGTHGVIVDFIGKLKTDPKRLEVLGNGNQAKPYLHVSDCVDGMLYGWRKATDQLNYFNLGCTGATSVRQIAEFLLDAINLKNAYLDFGTGTRGWIGDVPQVRLDCRKFEKFGWTARMTSDEAVRLAAKDLVEELACRS